MCLGGGGRPLTYPTGYEPCEIGDRGQGVTAGVRSVVNSLEGEEAA
jgi:hypothetical protein